MDILNALKSLDFWQTIGLIVSIAFTLWQARLKIKENRAEAYNRLHEEYISFLQVCNQHPELGFSEFEEEELQYFSRLHGGDKERAKSVLDLCNLLTAIWEHAFLLRSSMSKGQWEGWDKWVRDYLKRSKVIREGVRICVPWYDPDFVKFAQGVIEEVERGLVNY